MSAIATPPASPAIHTDRVGAPPKQYQAGGALDEKGAEFLNRKAEQEALRRGEVPSFEFPVVENGQVVDFWKGELRDPTVILPALVTAVLPEGRVSLTLFPRNGGRYVMTEAAVAHINDKRQIMHPERVGHWDLRDSDKRQLERIAALERQVGELVDAITK